jgi:hypothetical protein
VLGAPLLAASLLTSLAVTAAGAPVARGRAPGYQVLVTSAPSGAHLAQVLPAAIGHRAAPVMTLRLGGRNLAVPLTSQAGHRPASFAVSALAHGKQSVSITAGHIQLAARIPVAGAAVQVSVDNGSTWQPAEVKSLGAGRFLASFTAAGGATVSLRVTARDSAGNSLSETIPGAYRTSS